MDILNAYASTAPTPQNVIDIFKGEWSSRFPAKTGIISTPGTAALFEDPRIEWISKSIGGFAGKHILELGPLEAGHTYMMHEAGAEAIIAVEANSRSFLKCLCVKEIFNLNRARFLFGEALEYLVTCAERFDLTVASGILYHSTRPIELLRNLGRTSDTLFLWTHYYDENQLRTLGKTFEQFETPQTVEIDSRTYTMVRRNYGEALEWSGFCGGGQNYALWMTRETLIQVLADISFAIEAIGFDAHDHPNGPSLALLARRR